MKSVKFSKEEIKFIRRQYEIELKEAEEHVQTLRSIVEKLGVSETVAMLEPVNKRTQASWPQTRRY